LGALGSSIDGGVAAAGIAIDKPFVDQTWDEFTRIQDINVGPTLPVNNLDLDNLRSLGARSVLHCTARGETDHQAKHSWQHCAYRVPIILHWSPRLQDGSLQCIKRRRFDAFESTSSRTCEAQPSSQHHFARFCGFTNDQRCTRIKEQAGGRSDVAGTPTAKTEHAE
jgi:hypothetical protein